MRTLGWFKSVGLITAASIFALPFIFLSKVAQSQSSRSVHLMMGNPSNALASPTNYLLLKDQYALSYNKNTNIPNWVSWQLKSSWLGSAPRGNDFKPDTTLPSRTFYRVTTSDYNGSGFNRGHMVPSADRTKTAVSNSATFLMTNIIPHSPDNNQGPWKDLEQYSRTLVSEGSELYIISGGYGECGTGSNGMKCSIPDRKNNLITVPARTWKVIVILNSPGSGVRGVTRSTRVITVDIPNTQGIGRTSWKNYLISVNTLERRTGYNFLSAISPSIQEAIEAKVDGQ